MGCPATGCIGYELANDLNMNGLRHAFWSISGFSATFEGNGHTIDNLRVRHAMFGNITATGVVRNLTLTSIGVGGRWNAVGGLAAVNHGTITNVHVSGSVATYTRNPVGGLVGLNGPTGTISDSSSAGRTVFHSSATTGRNIGGLVGRNEGAIRGSFSTARVQGAHSSNMGGLVGYNDTSGSIRASYATGEVWSEYHHGWRVAVYGRYLGGLVGDNYGQITASYATGRARGRVNWPQPEDVGGLVGRNTGGTITDSYWDTRTSGWTSSAGGLGKTTEQLQRPQTYDGIYANWNLDLDGDDSADDPWEFGSISQYPILKALADRPQHVVPPRVQPVGDAAVSLSVSNTVAEGSWVRVQVTLSRELGHEVTIPLVVTRGTSEAGDHGTQLSVRFPAGFGSASSSISTAHDDDTDDETFTVALGTLPSGVKAGSPSSVLVTIVDDDANPPQVMGSGGDGSSGTDGDTGYTELIAQIRGWRNNPQWSISKPHTDRWDRALLAFGETVSDTTLTPMTASEAQGYADRGWTRWVDVAEALRALEAASTPPDPQDLGQPVTSQQLVPPALHGDLISDMNDWRNDLQWSSFKPHTDRWDRTLLTFGEPVSGTLQPMTASEAQGYADRGWTRWVGVAAALQTIVTGTSGAETLTGTDSGELLVGLGGDDTLNARGGNDELRGGGGDDDLSGGGGADRFVFFSNQTGANAISDFEAGDVIVLLGSGWSSVSDIIASVQAIGSANYRYTLAPGLTVETTNNRSLRTEDFVTE